MEAGPNWLVVGWISLHVAAIVVACCTRIAAGSRLENLAQLGFFAAMAGVGAAAWICQQIESGSWGMSALTLIAMVLTAVIDFHRVGDHRHVTQAF